MFSRHHVWSPLGGTSEPEKHSSSKKEKKERLKSWDGSGSGVRLPLLGTGRKGRESDTEWASEEVAT